MKFALILALWLQAAPSNLNGRVVTAPVPPSEITVALDNPWPAYVAACSARNLAAFNQHEYYWYFANSTSYCASPSPSPDFPGQQDWTQ